MTSQYSSYSNDKHNKKCTSEGEREREKEREGSRCHEDNVSSSCVLNQIKSVSCDILSLVQSLYGLVAGIPAATVSAVANYPNGIAIITEIATSAITTVLATTPITTTSVPFLTVITIAADSGDVYNNFAIIDTTQQPASAPLTLCGLYSIATSIFAGTLGTLPFTITVTTISDTSFSVTSNPPGLVLPPGTPLALISVTGGGPCGG